MKKNTTHKNRYLAELKKEQLECAEKRNKYKKNITSMKQFGGLRLLGYVDQKPLIAQYKIDSNGFSMKFNQQIMDKEHAGSFNKKFLDSNLEVYTNGRLSAPLGTIPKRIKGGNTTIGTIAWIATLIEIENMKSELAYVNSKISKNFFHYVAQAIFTSDAIYVEDFKDSVGFMDAIKFYQLKDNTSRNNRYLDTALQSRLYPQFLNEIKNKENISYTAENRLIEKAA